MGGRDYKYWVTGGFLLLVTLDFLAAAYGNRTIHTFVRVLPTWLLFAATFRPKLRECLWMPLAFFFSGFGDMMGVQGQFLWQIAFFAIAHVCFIVGFCHNMKFGYLPLALTTVLTAAVSLFFAYMLPHIGNPTEKVFVIIYAAVIFAMGAAAMFQTGKWKAGYAIAAFLFIFSDAVIAWRRFVGPIPHSAVIVMSTYYSAQLLFAFSLMRRAENPDQ